MSVRASLLALALVAVAAGPLTSDTSAQPGRLVFERAADVEAALPQSSVNALLQDRRGFLWFATREGLGRWDGYAMRTWRRAPFDARSLPGNLVLDLAEDAAGDLWARTAATDWIPTGIARLVGPAHTEVRRYGHADAQLFVGPDGAAWLADSTRLWRFDRARDAFVPARPRLRRSRTVGGLATRDGTVWLATDDGLEAYPPDGPTRMVRPEGAWPHAGGNQSSFGALVEDARGRLWVGGAWIGVLDAGRQSIRPVALPTPPSTAGHEGYGISHMVEAADGLWLTTFRGVSHYRPTDGTLTPYALPGTPVSVASWLTTLARDRAGTIWVGTLGGLHRAAPTAPLFRLLAHDPDDPNSLGPGLVLAVTRDARGALWVGTLGGGLSRIAPDGTVTRLRHDPDDPTSLRHDVVWSVLSDGATLWVGTGLGLDAVRLDAPRTVRHHEFLEPPEGDLLGPSALSLRHDPAGTLWFAHTGGAYRRSPAGEVRVLPVDAPIEDILPVPGGAWIATTNGLRRYDEAQGRIRAFRHDPAQAGTLTSDATLTLHRDRHGRLWVGTQSGLNRYDPQTGGFVHYTTADGLPSDVIYAILEDAAGRLWLSTNRGLVRYDETAPQPFRAFTAADGVGNVEFNRHAAFRDADGTMYFGGDRGVTVFHPDAVEPLRQRAAVVVTAAHRATRRGAATDPYVGPEGVVLAPDVTTVGFEFAALDFLTPHQRRYAVRLDGWDEGWIAVGRQRQATYTNLPPGRYTFRVRAADADGRWGDDAAVPLIVRPAFYETWTFRACAALALLALVAGVGWDASRRRYRRELAALEARRAIEAERARISRDMHDEVGASLSEIAVLSEVARRQLGASDATEERLARIAESSREMLDRLGQIVWAVNPRHDQLPALAGYLREHAARYLDAHGIEARLQFPARAPERPVSAEVRRTALLVLKEALHNAAKHAEAGVVGVRFEADGARLSLTVRDDGRGFELSGDGATPSVGGDGLGNMARRAREVGGTLDVTSEAGAGCVVRLDIPLAPVPRSTSPEADRMDV